MKIGEAAQASGTSPRALRLYEDEGLIVPGRLSNGYRDYCSGTIDRVRTIRRLLESGLPLRLVKDVLPSVLGRRLLDPQTRDEVRRYHNRLLDRIVQLDRRRATLATFLGQVDAFEDLTLTHASGFYGPHMANKATTPDLPPNMKGLVQQSLDGPEALELVRDLPVPQPGPQGYLVKVGAAGLNFADVMQTTGRYAGGPSAPYVAGFEVAGEIVAAGSEVVDPLPIGSHILGVGPGAFAEYVAVPAVAAAPVPKNWSDAASLGLVLNWGTALAALRPIGRLAPNEWVLVHAAAGGVGQAAVRLARHYGARVLALAARHKHEVLTEVGADVILDRSSADLTAQIIEATGGIDLVLESIGRTTFETSLSVAKPFTGRVVVVGAASGDASVSTHDLVFKHRVHIAGLHIGAFAEQAPGLYAGVVAELDELIRAGVIEPGKPTLYSLDQGAAAMHALADGGTIGKLAIAPST